MTESRVRLDQPKVGRSPRLHLDADSFGRWTEKIARFLGTGRYLAIQTIFVIVWISFNVAAVTLRFDPYPFILLNLAFSTQAAYAAPLILLAQNRQDDRDRIQYDSDRDEARQSKADLEYLARELAGIRMALGEVATRDFLRSELTRLEDVNEREAREAREKAKRKAREAREAKAEVRGTLAEIKDVRAEVRDARAEASKARAAVKQTRAEIRSLRQSTDRSESEHPDQP